MLPLAVLPVFDFQGIVAAEALAANGKIRRDRLRQDSQMGQGLVGYFLQECHTVFGIRSALLDLDGRDRIPNRSGESVAGAELVIQCLAARSQMNGSQVIRV